MSTEDNVKALLGKLSASGASTTDAVTPEQVHLLATALSPSSSQDAQSLGLICLSKIAELVERSGGTATDHAKQIKDIFNPLVTSALAEGSPSPASLVPAVSLLAALGPLAPAGVVALLTQRLGVAPDAASPSDVDPLAVLLEFSELPSPLQPAFASLLSGLAGTKAGRELVRTRAHAWLSAAAESKDVEGDTAVLCAVALSKLGREEQQAGEADADRHARDAEIAEIEEKLARTLAGAIRDSSSTSSSGSILPTLEGLSVLSTRPPIRELLASDKPFLEALLALSPVPHAVGGSLPVTPRESMSFDDDPTAPVDAALCYGVTTILVNLTSRKPVMSEHDANMARLRRMALAGKTVADADEEEAETNEAVQRRVDAVIAAGVIPALRGLVRAESLRVKEGLGRLCLNIVEDKSHRAVFVRDGGFRVLSLVVRDLTTPKVVATGAADALPACQALAKLVISTPPQLLFPAPFQTNALNALSPLYLLLVDTSASLLQRFESLMALTNLASIDPSFGGRIVEARITPPPSTETNLRGVGAPKQGSSERVLSRVEDLLLDDNTLVRRAATELVCNLVNSDVGYQHFSGEHSSSSEPGATPNARAAQHLGILLLLMDVDDLPTRLAAGGALAVLTESPAACKALLAGAGISGSKRTVWDRVGDAFEPGGTPAELDDDGEPIETISNLPADPGLAYRASFVLSNLLTYVKEELGDLQRAEEIKKVKDAKLEDKIEKAVTAFMPNHQLGPGVDVNLIKALLDTRKSIQDA